ncbi:MAG: 3-deoxy-8-phosphooctulonate synthase [Candidatus Anammoxibacter sp.]
MKICNFNIGDSSPLLLIGGPCVIESYESCLNIASRLKSIAESLKISFVFKASYDKANRTSFKSYRGPGIEKGIEILLKIKEELNVPVLSDVHCINDIDLVKDALDIIQIPAFLCRQTDLILAAAKSGKPVNVKKGQFLSPWDMKYIAEKIHSTGNENVIFTERGSSFGYNNLVSDMRSIVVIKEMGYPVIYDATHSVQLPGGQGEQSGGDRNFVLPLAKAAVAAGCDGLFIETHEDPEKALSDSATMVGLNEVEGLLRKVVAIRNVL